MRSTFASRIPHLPHLPQPSLSLILLLALLLAPTILASSGDRNPTFLHCLKGCGITYCDPSQPPIPLYLRAFGWDCQDNCKYSCMHSFTDNIKGGGRWHQCELCQIRLEVEWCGQKEVQRSGIRRERK